MVRHTLAIHPLCPTSRSLVKGLAREGLLDKLDLVVLDRPRPLGEAYPWSVPILLSPEGEPLAIDPLGPGEAAAIITGRPAGPGRSDEEQFAMSVLYSAYASSIALSHRSLEPLLDPSFLSPALRLPLRGEDPDSAARRLGPRLPALYEREKERIARALSVAITRLLWYAGASEESLQRLSEDRAGAIVIAMASVGRAFLPVVPGKPDMAGFIASFISRRARGLLAKVRREHENILGDTEYWGLLGISPRA